MDKFHVYLVVLVNTINGNTVDIVRAFDDGGKAYHYLKQLSKEDVWPFKWYVKTVPRGQ